MKDELTNTNVTSTNIDKGLLVIINKEIIEQEKMIIN